MITLAILAGLVGFLIIGLLVTLAAMLHLVLPLVVTVAALLFCLSLLALYPGSIIWAYWDAKSRGKPGWALALLVALSPFFALVGWPLSLLAWVVFRPEKKVVFSNLAADSYGSTPAHS